MGKAVGSALGATVGITVGTTVGNIIVGLSVGSKVGYDQLSYTPLYIAPPLTAAMIRVPPLSIAVDIQLAVGAGPCLTQLSDDP